MTNEMKSNLQERVAKRRKCNGKDEIELEQKDGQLEDCANSAYKYTLLRDTFTKSRNDKVEIHRKRQKISTVPDALKRLQYLDPVCPVYFRTQNPRSNTQCAKYFGVLDLDVDLTQVESGIEPIVVGDEPSLMTHQTAKKRFYDFLAETKCINDCASQCPAFDRLLKATINMITQFREAGIEHIAYFSGGKGVRVLIKEVPVLWKKIRFNVSCGTYGGELVRSWLRDLQVSETALQFIDEGPYTFNGGTKSDLQEHPSTKLWPQPFGWDAECEVFDSTYENGRDDVLCAQITNFWKELSKTIPIHLKEADIIDQRSIGVDAGQTLQNDIKRIVQNHVDSVEEFGSSGVVTEIRPHRDLHVVIVKGVKWCERGQRHHSNTGKTSYCFDMAKGHFYAICQSETCKKQPIFKYEQHDLGLYKLLEEGDIGWSKIAVLTLRDTVKVIDRKSGEAYVYDSYTGLWKQKLFHGVLPKISEAIVLVIDRYIEQLNIRLQNVENEDEKKEVENQIKFIESMQSGAYSNAKLSSLYKLAIQPLYVKDFEDTLNKAYPHLFPIRGRKVIDLRTGKVGELCKEHYFCFAGPRMYTPKRSYPIIEKLISSLMCGNQSTMKYLRLKMGLFLTGELLREIDQFIGDGRNGKSTFYALIEKVMGRFFTLIPKDLVVKNKFGSSAGAAAPYWIAVQLARCAFFDEVEEGERVNARNIKRMANGDPTPARGLYQGDYHTVTPRCQVVICVNKDLIYDSTDKAMTDRMLITPWPANFEKTPLKNEQKQDDNFIKKIENNHLDDLFSYMVDAAIDFYKNGKIIDHPKEVLDKTAEVNNSMNSVNQFVNECCRLRPEDENEPHCGKDEEFKVRPSKIYAEYTSWLQSQDMNAKKIGRAQFPKALTKIRGVHKRKFNGDEYWVGIHLEFSG